MDLIDFGGKGRKLNNLKLDLGKTEMEDQLRTHAEMSSPTRRKSSQVNQLTTASNTGVRTTVNQRLLNKKNPNVTEVLPKFGTQAISRQSTGMGDGNSMLMQVVEETKDQIL